ncbi:MAG: bifunctional 5,10-methylene-tetrahydrofolate dehydrogenase/5,10-methylene-tetrahydrofolate cyclohydrolase [Bacteroidia bacterium]|nr:bifunctional 5,10-methylene-tetrahydrofolate dehydrogenase/5,10-methylene-tetrahydrofolate cyclohydrolase [Bacteroidia bacterium]
MNILDGKATAGKIKQRIAADLASLPEAVQRPQLAAVLVGHNGASETYVAAKVKACNEIGFGSKLIRFADNVSENELLACIQQLNEDNSVHGIIVQLPLPQHIDEQKVTMAVKVEKDVDGFHPENLGRLMLQLPGFVSATPKGILMLLEEYKIETSGKHCVVLGRSNIVGTPVSLLMSRNAFPGNSTVSLCHSKTKDLALLTKQADILIAALGRPQVVTAEMVKQGAVVIDVGITRVADTTTPKGYRIAGDVDFEKVAPKTSWITPVPGGVGAMTIAALMQNTYLAWQRITSSDATR